MGSPPPLSPTRKDPCLSSTPPHPRFALLLRPLRGGGSHGDTQGKAVPRIACKREHRDGISDDQLFRRALPMCRAFPGALVKATRGKRHWKTSGKQLICTLKRLRRGGPDQAPGNRVIACRLMMDCAEGVCAIDCPAGTTALDSPGTIPGADSQYSR